MLARIRKIQPNAELTPSDVDALLAFHRAVFGGARMEGEGDAAAAEKAAAEKAAAEKAAADTAAAEKEAAEKAEREKGGGDGKKFDQAELDRIVGQRLADERTKFARELEAEKEKAGKSEAEKAALDRARAEEERDHARKLLGVERLANAARDAALAQKANPERVAAIIRLAELEGCSDDEGNIETGKVASAIEKVLKDYPEFKKGVGKSGGDLNGDPKSDPTLEDFRKMDYKARSALHGEKPELYRKLADADLDALA